MCMHDMSGFDFTAKPCWTVSQFPAAHSVVLPWQMPRFPHNTFLYHYWSWTLYSPTYSESLWVSDCFSVHLRTPKAKKERKKKEETTNILLLAEKEVFKEVRMFVFCLSFIAFFLQLLELCSWGKNTISVISLFIRTCRIFPVLLLKSLANI